MEADGRSIRNRPSHQLEDCFRTLVLFDAPCPEQARARGLSVFALCLAHQRRRAAGFVPCVIINIIATIINYVLSFYVFSADRAGAF